MRIFSRNLFFLLLIFVLPACTSALLDTASRNIFLREDVNLVEKNYAAADYLIGQSLNSINRTTTIHAEPLLHANKTGMSSAFGEVVIDQIAARISQLGYRVSTPDPDVPRTNFVANSGVKLGGTYLTGRQEANISLRLVDIKSNIILGSYDYIIPINTEIAELLEDKPTVFRVSR